jgi:hypothetical protein
MLNSQTMKLLSSFIFALAAMMPLATAGERTMTAAEANGTYRDIESKSEIKILALGHGKLKVQLALVYQREFAATANVGEATIENDVAVFVPEAAGECKITSLNFARRQDLLNARSTRTTHPKTIWLLQELFRDVASNEFTISTPFFWDT